MMMQIGLSSWLAGCFVGVLLHLLQAESTTEYSRHWRGSCIAADIGNFGRCAACVRALCVCVCVCMCVVGGLYGVCFGWLWGRARLQLPRWFCSLFCTQDDWFADDFQRVVSGARVCRLYVYTACIAQLQKQHKRMKNRLRTQCMIC
jgi:hypothetical protein